MVKMEELRRLCGAIGLGEVETFIASGNVVFRSRMGAAEAESVIEEQLRSALGYEVVTFVRSDGELRALSEYVPFPGRVDGERLYVNFGKDEPTGEMRERLAAIPREQGEVAVFGRELLWSPPPGGTVLVSPDLERITGQKLTNRNFNTIRRLVRKYPQGR